jgi:hypothetical protein
VVSTDFIEGVGIIITSQLSSLHYSGRLDGGYKADKGRKVGSTLAEGAWEKVWLQFFVFFS